jgi:hypothetical protein
MIKINKKKYTKIYNNIQQYKYATAFPIKNDKRFSGMLRKSP